jgi:D-alanyl-D-alanine carboxypeptidase
VLRLDDTVAKWVDDVPNGDRITLLQLLTHRSGLFDTTSDSAVWPIATPRTWTPDELLDVVRRHSPSFEPGASYEYSNTNFLVAGMVAEAATGKALSALLREHILEPAHLAQTFSAPDDSFGSLELARGFDTDGNDVTEFTDMTWSWGAGMMAATPADVVAWIDALAGGRFFDSATQARLLAHSPTDDPETFAGLGIFSYFGDALGPSLAHSGLVLGYQTQAVHLVDYDTTVVAFVDRMMIDDDDFEADDLANAAFGVLFEKEYEAAAHAARAR